MDISSGAPWPVWLLWVQARTWKWGWESCLWVHVFYVAKFCDGTWRCIPWSGVRRVTSGLVRYCHQTQSFVFPWNASFVTKKCQVASFWIIEVVWYNRSKKHIEMFFRFWNHLSQCGYCFEYCEWRRNTLMSSRVTRHMDGLTIPQATIGINMSDWRPWSWSNDSAEEKKACPLNSWTQNWRNKDKPLCQEGGWNYVFLLVSLVLNPFCLDPWKRSLQRLTLTWS